MEHHAGIDVSLKESSVCVVDAAEKNRSASGGIREVAPILAIPVLLCHSFADICCHPPPNAWYSEITDCNRSERTCTSASSAESRLRWASSCSR